MPVKSSKEKVWPPQHQDKQPGIEAEMHPHPVYDNELYIGSKKLENKVALITGGDSGIGRAVAIAFAKEGGDVVVVYYDEHEDARETKRLIEEKGRRCVLIPGDIRYEEFCVEAVKKTVKEFGKINILVNNSAVQFPQETIEKITSDQLETTFRINIFSYFYFAKAVMKYFKKGDTIINSTSVTAYRGSHHLIDYSSTKGAIVAFTRSLSLALVKKGIRVNGVAPGPIWTPLIPSSFKEEKVESFGTDTPMRRAGQPYEMAPGYVFLASSDSSYMTGQILHLNGGEIING